jgi:hypothetical protein
MAVEQRLADIRSRYGPSHPVTRALGRSEPLLTAAVDRVTRTLSARMAAPRSVRLAPVFAF